MAGQLYIVGGRNVRGRGGHGALNSVERFDAQSGAWEALAPMSTQRARHSASVVAGKLYIVGGKDGQQYWNSAELFDAQSGAWEALAPMSTQRAMHSASVMAGQLYV